MRSRRALSNSLTERLVKRGGLCNMFGRSQQHCGVSVVAAGMHQTRMATGMGQPQS